MNGQIISHGILLVEILSLGAILILGLRIVRLRRKRPGSSKIVEVEQAEQRLNTVYQDLMHMLERPPAPKKSMNTQTTQKRRDWGNRK